ncbi:VCBS domain-containing protein [Paradonghicola geojensis]|nr:VCBS domain-containing protein [Marivivens geojensis]
MPDGFIVAEDQDGDLSGISVSDPDAGASDLLTVSLSVDDGVLTLGSTTGLTDLTNGAASIGFTGTLADINAALATLSYRAGANYSGPATLSVTVNDNGHTGIDPSTITGLSDTGTATTEAASTTVAITVASVNDAPTITVPSSAQSVDEDIALVLSSGTSNAIQIADVDAGSGAVRLTLSVANGTLSVSGTTGLTVTDDGKATVIVQGTISAINTMLDGGVTYTPDDDYNGADTLTLTLNDLGSTGDLGGPQEVSETLAITVNPVNDAPTVEAIAVSATEDTPKTFTLTSSDVDEGNDATTDATVDRYKIVTLPANGSLTTSDNQTISAGDIITVVQATDMTFTPAANFNGTTSFTFTALDAADAESGEATVTITVAAVNDTPAISGAGDSVSYTEGVGAGVQGTPVKLDGNGDLDLSDVELTVRGEDTFNSATLRVKRSGDAVSTDRYWFDTSGSGDTAVSIADKTISVGGQAIGTLSASSATSDLRITFNASATKASVEAVMRAVTFASTDDDFEGDITVAMTFNDGNAGTPLPQGSDRARITTVSFTVTVINTNDAPSFTANGAISVAEDTTDPTGTAISTIFSDKFSDLDDDLSDSPLSGSSLAGIAIVGDASDPAHEGHWEYSTDGTNWHDVSPGGTAPTETTALVLSASTELRFVPVADFNSRLNQADANPGALSVRPIDDSDVSRAFTDGATRETADVTSIDASSDIGGTSETIVATVTQVNDAPEILYLASTADSTLQFTEAVGVNVAGTAVLLDTLADDDNNNDGATPAEILDIDLVTRGETTFSGARLVIGDKTELDPTDLFVVQTGTGLAVTGGFTQPGSGITLFNSGSVILYSDVVVAALTDNSAASGQLIVTFNDNATSDAVNAVLRNVAYSNSNAALTTTDKTIEVAFFDGNGSTDNNQGTGGELSATADIVIALTAVNDSPKLSGGATIATVEDSTSTPTTFFDLLNANLEDPDSLTGTALEGVAISGFDTKSLGDWQVNLGSSSTPYWVSLAILSTNAGGLSSTQALLLSASTELRFVPDADDNTGLNATESLRPTLTVHGVENQVPDGASNIGPSATAPDSPYTTDQNSPKVWDTTTFVGESRVSAEGVTVDLTIAARNDAPTVTTSGTTTGFSDGVFTGTVVESPVAGVGTSTQQLLAGVTVSDIDLATTFELDSTVFGAGTITVTLASRVAGDVFTLDGTPLGVASTTGGEATSGDFVITLTDDATVAQVNAILEAIRYEHTSDQPPTTERSYTITLNDGDNLDADGDTAGGPAALAATAITGSITITGPNDPPTLTATAANPDFTENGTAVTLFSEAAVDTIESGQGIKEIVIEVSGLGGGAGDGANEKLRINGEEIDLVAGATSVTGIGIDVTVSGTTATVTLTPTSPIDVTSTATLINGLAYRHDGDDPTPGDRVVTITRIQDDGGTAASGVDATTLSLSSTVNVISVNDAPAVGSTISGTFTEGDSAPVQFLSGITVSDIDAEHFNGGFLEIAQGTYIAGDRLEIVEDANYTLSGSQVLYNSAVIGTIDTTSDGQATALKINFTSNSVDDAVVQGLLARIGFSSTNENPTVAGTAPTRAITVTLNDGGNEGETGGAKSDSVTGTIDVVGINDAPTLTGLDATHATTYIQDGTPIAIDADALLADADLAALTGTSPEGNWDGSTLTLQRQTTASTDDVFGHSGNLGSIAAASGNVVVSGTTIGSYTQSGGVLTLTFNANATTALVNEALQSITYSNAVTTAGGLSYNSITLDVTFNDQNSNDTGGGTAGLGQDQGSGGALSVSKSITINIDRLPEAVNDTNSVAEGVATTDTTTTSGNVITGVGNPNTTADSDDDIEAGGRDDALSIVNAKDSSVDPFTAVTVGSTSATNGTDVTGDYGTLTIGADGSYIYAVDNTNGDVQALATGETLTDTFTYQLSDGQGGLNTADLTITITGTNDDPVISIEDGDNATTTITETNGPLLSTLSLTVSDVDLSNTVSPSVDGVVISGTYGGVGSLDNTTFKNYLATNFEFQAGLLKFTADNAAEVYLNGQLIGETNDWQQPYTFTGLTVLPGTNVLSVLAWDVGSVAAMSGKFEMPDGTSWGTSDIAGWKVFNADPDPATDYQGASRDRSQWILPDGWNTVAYDDSAWDTPFAVSDYERPWGADSSTRTGDPTWIWWGTDTEEAYEDGAYNTDVALFRYDFTGSSGGNALQAGEDTRKVNWTFDSSTEDFDYLAKGETIVLDYTITVSDSNSPSATDSEVVTVTIQGSNDTPDITPIDVVEAVHEDTGLTDGKLTGTGSLTFEDLDESDLASTTVALKSATTTGPSIPTALTDALETAVTLSGDFLEANSGTVTWDWALDNNLVQYLADGETVTVTYTISVTDDSGVTTATAYDEVATATQDVTITITGTNDKPVITQGDDTSALTETNTTITDTGTMIVTDIDVSDTIAATVESVSISGGSYTTRAGYDRATDIPPTDTELANMLSLAVTSGDISSIEADPISGSVFEWNFSSGDEGIVEVQKVSLVPNLLGATNKTFSIGVGSSAEAGVTVNSGAAGFSTATEMAAAFQAHPDYDQLPYVISADATDTALIITFKSPGDAATRTLAKWGDHGTLFTEVEKGVAANTSPNLDFAFLAKDETLELTYTVKVTDSSGANSGEATTDTSTVVVTITGTNDTPDITVVEVTGQVTEDDSPAADNPNTVTVESDAFLNAAGSVTFDDLDLTDTSGVTHTFVSATPSTGASVSTALDTALRDLTNTFAITGGGVGTAAQSGTVEWDFSLDNALTQYLSAGETVTVTYRITVTDDSGVNPEALPNEINARTQDVTITLTGANDAPTITMGSGNSDAETLTETDGTLTGSGTLTVADVDLTNTVAAQVLSVAASDTVTGLLSDNAALKAMMSVTPATPLSSTDVTGQLGWSFDSGAEAFDYLATGEVLTLTYTIRVTDTSGATADKDVTLTITGTNDAPVISLSNNPPRVILYDGLNATGNILLDTDVAPPPSTPGEYDYNAYFVFGINDRTKSVQIFNATATFFNDNIGSTAKETYGSGIHDIVSGIGVSSFSFVSAAGAADSNVAALDETDAGLTTSGTLTVGDIDLTDVATATRTLAVSGTSDRDDPAAPGDTALQAMLTLSPTTILDGTQQTNTLGWSFDSGSEAFDYLAKGETLILEYTVTATDDDGTPLSDSETVTITITGTNDTPDIIATKVTGAVTEDATSGEPAALRDSGSISFADVDTSDTSTVTVALTGTPATTGPAIPSSLLTALQTAVTLSGDTSGANDGSVNWAFALDNAEAQYLAAGETVTVTYTISVTDDSGVSTASGNDEIDTRTQAVTITITGTNDAPVLSDTALTLTQAEDDGAPSGAVGTLVSTLAGGIGETDTTNPAGIAITATDTNRGTWYFSTDDGASWTSFTATDATARLLLADVDTRLYFQPDPQWHGSIDPALTLRAWDGSSGSNGGTADLSGTGITGGTTAFSTATDTVALKINPVNDQPTISKTVTLAAVDEDTTPSGAGLATLDFGYSDVTDDQDDANTATLLGGDTSTPFTYLAVVGSSNYSTDQGVWQISTSATPGSGDWIDIPASGLSDSAALVFNASSLIRFIPAADFFGTPGTLSVRLADGSVDLSGAVSTAGSDTADLSTNGGTGTTGAWSASTQSIALAAVTNVNDRPTATATTLTATTEDNANPPGATVATLGFGYSDATDDQTAISGGGDEDTAFGGIAVVGNDADAATEGVWQYSTDGGLNWTAIGTPSETAALLLPTDAKLRFLPNVADYYGTPGALDVRVSDTAVSFSASSDISAALTETDQWSLATTLSTSVLPVNDAPTGSDKTITIDEDTTHTLTVADFGFVDAVEGDALASVVITSLATAGTLEYSSNGSSWDPVTLGQEISATDITAARLRFVPEAHANADSYASFTFQLRDDGGTTNGGVDLDPSANTITFNVRPVNDAPVATGTATLAAIDEDSTDPAGATVATLFTGNFSDATDNSVASIANTLAGIAITDYTPDAAKGLWQYSSDGSEWTDLGAVNAEASALTLAATDRLRFVPAANYNGAAPALTVKLIDSSTTVTSGATRDVSTSGGTTAFSASDVVLSHSVTPKLDLPVITTTATAASFTENGAAVAIDPALTITDVDDTHLTGATVTITSNLRAGDVLAVSGTASGLVSGTNITVAGYDPATGVLTLTGTETLANYQAVLRSVTFVNTSDNPNANSATDPLDREITFAVTDANADGAEMLTDPAELLVVYPFDDNTDGSDGFGTTLFDTDALIGSAVTKGPGLGIFEVGTDSWSGSVQVLKTGPGTSVTSAGPADALANDWYFEVTLTPEAAASMDIRSIAADWSRGGSTATRGWFVRASTDNFESDLYSNETPPGTPTGLQQAAFNIDGFTGLTEPVSFRFYIYTDSMGRYMDFQSLRFSDVALGIGSTTRAVAVTAVNDAPTLTGTLANPTVVENAGANTGSSTVALLSGSGVTDADFFTAGTNFGGGKITVSLTDGYVSGDTLDIASAELAAGAVQRSGDDIQYSADGTGWVTIGAVNATGTGQATDLVIDLNTDADQTNVAAVLDALSFRSTSDDPTLKGTDTTRAYSITLNDGNNDDLAGGSHEEGADSNALTGTITITAVNDTPVLAAITAGSVADAVNSSALGSQSGLSGTLDGSDVDTPSASLLYAISSATGTGATLDGITYDQSHAGTYGTLYLNTATGAYRYEPDAAAINTLHKGETQTDSFDLTLTDGALTTTAQSFTITLTGANEAAVLADTTDPAAIVETADASAQNIAVQSGSFALSDEDVGDTITASIHGNPVVRLNGTTLDPDDYPAELTAEGALSLTNTSQTSNGGALTAIGWSYDPAPAALDFVAAGETLTITYAVQVSDGTETGTQTVTVTLTGTNDTPEITVGDVTGAVTEDTTSGDPAALRDSGSISIADLDRSDTLTVDVALTGTPSTTGPAIPQSLQDALETAVTLSGATSGANAGSVTWAFALDTAEVQYLAAGETVTATYRITVTDDSGVSAASGEDEVNTSTQDVTITITGTNDAPVITDGPDTANLSETDAALTANGSLTVSDVDVTDVVGATAALSVSGTSDRDDPAAPSDEDLRAMFRVTPAEILDGTQTSASLGWVFDSGTEAFDYLATGETLVLTYTVTATDDDGTPLGDSETVTITITGTNDAPVITDGPDTASLNETDAALTTSGSLTVSDVDTTDVVGASAALAVSGTSDRADPAAPSDEDLLAMFRVAPAAILDGTQNAASLGWSFDSGTEAFDYLATGETLVLTYTVTATDDDGTPLSDDETVTITITGTNDGPLVTREPEKQVHPVNVVYETDLPAGFSDVDTSDRFTYSATGLPAGLSIDPVTGRISGTPSTAGSFKVIITADDGNGGSVSTRAYDFLIVAPPSETIGGTETQIRQQAETPLANRFDVPVTAQSAQISLPGSGAKSLVTDREPTETRDTRADAEVTPARLRIVNFILPAEDPDDADVVGRDRPGLERVISANLVDGAPLPTWLDFNAETRSFSGVVPPEVRGDIDIVVTYLDTAGSIKTLNMRIDADSLAISVSDPSDTTNQSDTLSEPAPDDEARIDWDEIEERLFSRKPLPPPAEQGGLRAQLSRIA